MAGKVKGYRQAVKYFDVKAVCGVGMTATKAQVAEIYKANGIFEDMPAFCLQGEFEMDKLRGTYKLMMKTMKATVGKKLSGKADRTPEEDGCLNSR